MARLGRLAPAVPNALTVARVLLVPPLVALVLQSDDWSRTAAALLFALAALSDALDGHLARSRGLVSTFGKIADPIADKLLVGAALTSLIAVGRLAAPIAVVIMGRELAVSALRMVAAREGLVISASRFGKAKMGLQVATILALIAAPNASTGWLVGLLYVTVVVTVASGIDYFIAFRCRAEPLGVQARGAVSSARARRTSS